MDKFFAQLKEHFENKTIIAVDPTNIAEAIAKFTMSDGTSFRLHATDLGYWIEDTVPTNVQYSDFHTLFTDVYHHLYTLQPQYSFDAPEPTVEIIDSILRITTCDGKFFEGNINKFTTWEKSVCYHHEAARLLISASIFGDMWKVVFQSPDWNSISDEYRCPIELRIPWEK